MGAVGRCSEGKLSGAWQAEDMFSECSARESGAQGLRWRMELTSREQRRGSDQGKKGGRSSSEEGGESGKGFARLAGSMRSSLFKAKNSLRGLVSKP